MSVKAEEAQTSGSTGTASGNGPPREAVIDLAGDVTLEDSDDFGFGATLLQSALHIGLGARIRAQAGDHHPPERGVGLAIPAAIKPHAGHLARGGLDGSHAAEMGPGGLRADPPGIVADGHEQRGGSVDAHAVDFEQLRRGLLDELG